MSAEEDDTAEAKLLGGALSRLREAACLSQDAAARQFGSSAQNWSKYERGLARSIFQPSVQKRLAAAVGSDVCALLRTRNQLAGGVALRHSPAAGDVLPVRDVIQAGAWKRADDFDQRQDETYPAVRDPRYAKADQWVSRVLGDSMDLERIFEHDYAHFVDTVQIRYAPRQGDVVDVERLRFQGRERELSIKQVRIDDDGRVLLVPRSSNPRWREPLQLSDGAEEGEPVDVRIRGLLLQVYRRY